MGFHEELTNDIITCMSELTFEGFTFSFLSEYQNRIIFSVPVIIIHVGH